MSDLETRSLLGTAGTLVSLACEVVLIVVIAGVVRRYRPDAWKPILLWSLASEAVTRLKPCEALTRGVNELLGMPLTVALTALLGYSLVALVRPPATK